MAARVISGTIDPTALTRDRSEVLAAYDVSRETAARLDRFVELLLQWQPKLNLIGPSTVSSLWTRHVADSLQLLTLPDAKTARIWVDLGSGAGFPGLVIACTLVDRPGTTVHLIESHNKKAAFLREAARHTCAPAEVHAGRIEEIGLSLASIAQVITARALAPLDALLALVSLVMTKDSVALLMKGQDMEQEMRQATRNWKMEADIVPSRTSAKGQILVVRKLQRR
jgi:16S rRNA (guanine527-N7)-methyltransferase